MKKEKKKYKYKRKKYKFKEKVSSKTKKSKSKYRKKVPKNVRQIIKNKSFSMKLRKFNIKQKNFRKKLKKRKVVKLKNKSLRKRYKIKSFLYKAASIPFRVTENSTKENREEETGIKAVNSLSRKSKNFLNYRSRKSRRKPFLFQKKARKLEKKISKLEKRTSYQRELQKLNRKINYKKSSTFQKYKMKRAIKKKYNYTFFRKNKQRLLKLKEKLVKIFKTLVKHLIRLSLIFVALILFIYLTTVPFTSIFRMFTQQASETIAYSSYLSDVDTLKEIEKSFRKKEERLLDEIYNPEKYHLNYDLFKIDSDDIGHDVHQLLSYITAKFGKIEDSKNFEKNLKTIFDKVYKITYSSSIVQKDIDTEGALSKRKLKQLTIHIRKTELKDIAKKEFSLHKENLEHFEILLESKGNMEEEFQEFEKVQVYGNRKLYKPAVGYQPAMEKYINSKLVIPGSIRQAVLMWAATHEGIPYVLGAGHGVAFGEYGGALDCSSFVCNAWGLCGGNIDRVYATFYMPNKYVKSISKSELKPGDAILNQQAHIEMFLGFDGGYRTTGSHMEGVPSGMSFWGQQITHFVTLSNLDEPADSGLLNQLEEEIKKYDPNFERRK